MLENNKVVPNFTFKQVATRTGLMIILLNLLIILATHQFVDSYFKSQSAENEAGIDQLLTEKSLRPIGGNSGVLLIDKYQTQITKANLNYADLITPIQNNRVVDFIKTKAGIYVLYSLPFHIDPKKETPQQLDITEIVKSIIGNNLTTYLSNTEKYLVFFDSSNQLTLINVRDQKSLLIKNNGDYISDLNSLVITDNSLNVNVVNQADHLDILNIEIDLRTLFSSKAIENSVIITTN